jgi:hypothetical protein
LRSRLNFASTGVYVEIFTFGLWANINDHRFEKLWELWYEVRAIQWWCRKYEWPVILKAIPRRVQFFVALELVYLQQS